jgi:hypothetical protein
MFLRGRKVRRHRFNVSLNLEGHEINISTRFSDSTRAGRAAGYLNSGEIDKRTGVEIAIACLFAPLREAQEGATRKEIEQSIATSQALWEGYMNLARLRCKGSSSQAESTTKLPQAKAKPPTALPKQSVEPPSPHSETNTDDDDTDIENEVL